MELRAVRGMNDILPDEVVRWQRLEAAFRRHAELHGYAEVRTEEPNPARYVYYVRIDWPKLRALP